MRIPRLTLFSGRAPKPLRQARTAGRQQVRDCRRLLRRALAKRRVTPAVQAEILAAIKALQEALVSAELAGITARAATLQTLHNKYLASSRKPAWRESVESIGVAVLIALLLRFFVLEAFKIPSGSMIPTLAIGDQIFVNKFRYGLRLPLTSWRMVEFAQPRRGEVIVFVCPVPPNEDYIKRVIGLAGDTIAVRQGVVYVNGQAIERQALGAQVHWDFNSTTGRWYAFDALAFREQWGGRSYEVLQDASALQRSNDFGPFVVPPEHVFVMGDNRDHSYDSRAWGPVPLANVLGRSMFVWWSWGRKTPDWSRLFTVID